ncbi:MAG: DAK2 domain-containing protein, partial [Haloechinothrix sp.]
MRALDAAAVAAWAEACLRGLTALRSDIDSINVYPVPDSDTGSNLLHTITGAHAALDRDTVAGAGPAFAQLARGAVGSARGNSGVILSQLLRGLAESVGDAETVDGAALALALARADRRATEAVARPVDGTMLTVLRESAHAAARVSAEAGDLAVVVAAAATSAATALARTPQQLAVLADAGVVDAGGRGVLAILDELVAVITARPAVQRAEFVVPQGRAARRAGSPLQTNSQPWEVMYLLDGVNEAALPALRDALSALGDCVTIAGDGAGSYAVHVHCGDIGPAIEAGLVAGRPREVRVESLPITGPVGRVGGRAVVAVVPGADLAELCREEGVTVLGLPNGQPPSVDQVEQVILDAAADHVTVLPGGIELTGVADEAAERVVAAGRDVVVIPCASSVQVLAALAVHDADRRVGDDVVAMAEAAAATRRGELVIAAEDAITWIGRAAAGDLVGFVDDEV